MDNLMPVDILLVEDNPADARIIIDHFKKSQFNIIIKYVKDGAEALDYLHQKGNYKTAFLPHIIILDMNLPKVDGMTVLKIIKDDKNLRNIPVIIFGTSGDSKEVKNAYKSHANCYIIKPMDYDHFDIILSCIENFWINLVKLPPDYE